MTNSARNGKKIGGKFIFWRQMAIFGGSGGIAAVFLNT